MDQKPRRGSFARCSRGFLGLITCDEPQEVTYPDGNNGVAWVGIHLTGSNGLAGRPWSSRMPVVVGHVEEIEKR
jgi:hypothetical protein